ncbi:hypothetical protein [Spartinivicinus poritis]|uniref:Uncharacterized protein n=1 Tax=Spartinivicinus poritis TaxID=2994640 RepID=A0ABT5UKK8_9GAMM|nr:hypothetical protein [Spartinivicinus sp. A2-2]MDE1466017.1 hypothetical protein [Spartinivicinus sp. A2-2]
MNRKDEQEVKRKLKVLAYAQETGNVIFTPFSGHLSLGVYAHSCSNCCCFTTRGRVPFSAQIRVQVFC